MKARVLEGARALEPVDLLRARGWQVVAPFQDRGRDAHYEPVTDQNRAALRLHVPNPLLPPKRFVLPQLERLLRVRGPGGAGGIEATVEAPRLALFGARSCDVAGLGHLDRFFLGGAFRDPYYAARREHLFVVNVACTDPAVDLGPRCFCPCADAGPFAREGFDLQLLDLGGEVMAVAGTPAGEELLAATPSRPCTAADVARRRALLAEVRAHLDHGTTAWFAAAVGRVSRGEVPEATWEAIGRRCLECGGCTYVCPACTCFTVCDRPCAPGEVERVRAWDSCALSGFTRMAGGHNPRKAVHDRRNRRFFRKLSLEFVRREGSVACVGCGRCAEVCHGDVGMPTVVELLRRGGDAPGRPA